MKKNETTKATIKFDTATSYIVVNVNNNEYMFNSVKELKDTRKKLLSRLTVEELKKEPLLKIKSNEIADFEKTIVTHEQKKEKSIEEQIMIKIKAIGDNSKRVISYKKEREHIANVLDKKTEYDSNSYDIMLRKFEHEYVHNYNDSNFGKTLFNMGCFIAKAVIKRVVDPKNTSNGGHDKKLIDIQRQLLNDISRLEQLEELNNNCYEMKYNSDGDLVKVVNKENALGLYKSINTSLCDGMDLVNVAIESLLENCIRYKSIVFSQENFLEYPIIISRLRKKTFATVNEDNFKKAHKDETSCIIKESYRDVRRYIMDNRALTVDSKYLYIEELMLETNENSTSKDCYVELYRRVKNDKTAFVGGALQYEIYSDTEKKNNLDEIYDNVNALIEKLKLSDRQARILQMRLQGYGLGVIADTLNIKKTVVQNHVERIQKKAIVAFGLDENIYMKKNEIAKSPLEDSIEDIVKMYESGRTMAYIASVYNVSKMTISRLIKKHKNK